MNNKLNYFNFNIDIIFNLIIVLLWCFTCNIVQESLIIGNFSSLIFICIFFVLKKVFFIRIKKIKTNKIHNFLNRKTIVDFYLKIINLNLKYIYIYYKNILINKKKLKIKESILTLKIKLLNKSTKILYNKIFYLNTIKLPFKFKRNLSF